MSEVDCHVVTRPASLQTSIDRVCQMD